MACAACQKQRMAVSQNLRKGEILGAATNIAKGVGMMAGVVAKPAVTRESAQTTPVAKPKHILSKPPFPNLLKPSATNKDRGFGK